MLPADRTLGGCAVTLSSAQQFVALGRMPCWRSRQIRICYASDILEQAHILTHARSPQQKREMRKERRKKDLRAKCPQRRGVAEMGAHPPVDSEWVLEGREAERLRSRDGVADGFPWR